jgi:hypothetical protein
MTTPGYSCQSCLAREADLYLTDAEEYICSACLDRAIYDCLLDRVNRGEMLVP